MTTRKGSIDDGPGGKNLIWNSTDRTNKKSILKPQREKRKMERRAAIHAAVRRCPRPIGSKEEKIGVDP